MNLPSPMELLEFFQETGHLVWRVNRGRLAKAGDVAGCLYPNGYITIRIDGRLYLAHRLVWLYVTGEWPAKQIDHIDGNPSNNRFENLREATYSENGQNRRKANNNNLSCGLLGVTWHKPRKKWAAKIMLDGKYRHIGLFATPELAHAAYLAAKRELHPFNTLQVEQAQAQS